MASMIGNSQLDMEVLKEPRGFIRCLQWFFAMLAFATCCDFSTKIAFDIECKNQDTLPIHVSFKVNYPFRLDQIQPFKLPAAPCGINIFNKSDVRDTDITLPGDFSSDAQFFVFIGVISWLYCFLSIAVYVFYSTLYADEQKSYPKIDLIITAFLALFWLAGSSAWANGLSGLKVVTETSTWIYSSEHDKAAICYKTDKYYDYTHIKECRQTSQSTFGGANVSVLFGFLNCFLWTCNLWFLYKETNWFKAKENQGNMANIDAET